MSLKKIAEKCQTSVSTVSRVLNHPEHQCHDKQLADAIWNAAKELHYLPNTAARALKQGSSHPSSAITVDILLTRFDSLESDLFFQELYHSVKESLLQNQALLGDILTTYDIQHRSKNTPIPAFKQTKGLIILGKCPGELLPALKNLYPYLIAIDRNPTDYVLDEIVCNGTSAALLAMEHLISLGHTKIAYIGDCSYEARYIGYHEALINHKLPIDYRYIYPTGQTRAEGIQAMEQILSKEARPTGIFCANDTTALGVLECLNHHKREKYLPSVISIDNIKESEQTSPLLTTVNIPKQEMGRLAVTMLLDRVNGGHNEVLRVELPCKLVLRDSCYYHAGN